MPVDDPYNMYFTPDGKSAIVVAEAEQATGLPRPADDGAASTRIHTPDCRGINHADFSIDGRYAMFTCEFSGKLVKIDMVNRKVVGLPQACSEAACRRTSAARPTASVFYVADMMADGVLVVDGERFARSASSKPAWARTASTPAATARSCTWPTAAAPDPRQADGPGSVAVIDFATRKVVANWPIPGGGSPDMGNVSADGK